MQRRNRYIRRDQEVNLWTWRDEIKDWLFKHPETEFALGLLVRGTLVAMPIVADVVMWQQGVQHNNPDLLGAALMCSLPAFFAAAVIGMAR
jgi:hypothetical protein